MAVIMQFNKYIQDSKPTLQDKADEVFDYLDTLDNIQIRNTDIKRKVIQDALHLYDMYFDDEGENVQITKEFKFAQTLEGGVQILSWDDEEYQYGLFCHQSENGIRYDIERTNGAIQEHLNKDGVWEQPDFTLLEHFTDKQKEIKKKDDGEAALLSICISLGGNLTDDAWEDIKEYHQPLIDLYDAFPKLLCFHISRMGNIMLVPYDVLHLGVSFSMDGNGRVALNRYLESEMIAVIRDGEREEVFKDGSDYCEKAADLNLKEAEEFCRNFIDRSVGVGLYTFPLSENHVIRCGPEIETDKKYILKELPKYDTLNKHEQEGYTRFLKTLQLSL